mmetsp:Transcript_80053/g.173027  ORF Transcript_80053/g.173027 Transcript_80053/m.173027 type:complete len:291 (-) Transcript_80053:1257-2129(-)
MARMGRAQRAVPGPRASRTLCVGHRGGRRPRPRPARALLPGVAARPADRRPAGREVARRAPAGGPRRRRDGAPPAPPALHGSPGAARPRRALRAAAPRRPRAAAPRLAALLAGHGGEVGLPGAPLPGAPPARAGRPPAPRLLVPARRGPAARGAALAAPGARAPANLGGAAGAGGGLAPRAVAASPPRAERGRGAAEGAVSRVREPDLEAGLGKGGEGGGPRAAGGRAEGAHGPEGGRQPRRRLPRAAATAPWHCGGLAALALARRAPCRAPRPEPLRAAHGAARVRGLG